MLDLKVGDVFIVNTQNAWVPDVDWRGTVAVVEKIDEAGIRVCRYITKSPALASARDSLVVCHVAITPELEHEIEVIAHV